jgi:hypothetical protein
MAWVRFTADFDFKPSAAVTVGYLAGMVENVTTRCAAKTVAAGKAVRVKETGKDAEPEVSDGRREAE